MEKLKNLPEIILVNTQLPENLGAVARSMLNFNFKKLKLVSPEFNLNHEKYTFLLKLFDKAEIINVDNI